MENKLKLAPEVLQVIQPVVYDMTKAYAASLQYKVKPNDEPQWMKQAKRSCCHIILDSTGYAVPAVEQREDGGLYCAACGRKINTTFDSSNIEKINEVISIVNQALLFGLMEGIDPNVAGSLMAVKSILPDVSQLCTELNIKIQNKSTADAATNAIGAEYDSKYSQAFGASALGYTGYTGR